MTAHAKLSASGAHRWMNCPASISLEEHIPDSGSVFAAEGTAAHDVAEQCLRGGTNADDYLGETISVKNDDGSVLEFVVDQEMVDAVQLYIDYVRDQPGKLLVEQRVDFSKWVPGGFGTADAIILHDGTITVVDLKYGKGVQVFVEGNPQAMIYGLGCLNDFEFLYDFEKLKLVIIQPRMDHIDEWEITRDDLEKWADIELAPAAKNALSDDPIAKPGEKQCRFCKAKGSCRALAEFNVKTAVSGFTAVGEPLTLKDMAKLTNAEIAMLLPQLDILTNWVKAVKAYAFGELEAGREVPDYKLVTGRSDRKWIDEEAAGKALARKLTAAVVFTRKVIGITAAEKHLGKNSLIVKKHTHKPKGKPAIAPTSDKRQALEIDPTEGFKEVA